MKVGIVGAGMVGATTAYAMIMQGVGREIILVDRNAARVHAEADDLWHAVPFAKALQVRGGEYADLKGCRAVVVAAGVNQQPGETRLQLLSRNAAVFDAVIPQILEHCPEAILIVATNPVDIMTHLTARIVKQRGIPTSRVIGSGTTLDTARFRALLAGHLGIDAPHVHAYVIGEHGDSEVLNWSDVRVAGLSLPEICKQRDVAFTPEVRQQIDNGVRRAAYSIIQGKGSTYYGVGSALARIIRTVLLDHRAVLTVCTPAEEVAGVHDVTVSLPRLVGADGVLDTFPPRLDAEEAAGLARSAEIIRTAIDQLTA